MWGKADFQVRNYVHVSPVLGNQCIPPGWCGCVCLRLGVMCLVSCDSEGVCVCVCDRESKRNRGKDREREERKIDRERERDTCFSRRYVRKILHDITLLKSHDITVRTLEPYCSGSPSRDTSVPALKPAGSIHPSLVSISSNIS